MAASRWAVPGEEASDEASSAGLEIGGPLSVFLRAALRFCAQHRSI